MMQGTAIGKHGWPGRITGMVVASPAACGPQIDESHWGSIASPAPPTPASSPGQCRMSRDPLRSVARRVRCPGRLGHKHRTPHTAAARRSTSSEREKTKGRHVSVQERRSRPRTKECDTDSRAAGAGVRARPAHAHTQRTPPAGSKRRRERRESTPSKVKQRRYWSAKICVVSFL